MIEITKTTGESQTLNNKELWLITEALLSVMQQLNRTIDTLPNMTSSKARNAIDEEKVKIYNVFKKMNALLDK